MLPSAVRGAEAALPRRPPRSLSGRRARPPQRPSPRPLRAPPLRSAGRTASAGSEHLPVPSPSNTPAAEPPAATHAQTSGCEAQAQPGIAASG